MRFKTLVVVLGLCVASGSAWADPPAAPTNIKAEPSTPRSAKLTSESASAEIAGDPQAALKLADKAIAADPRNPWSYYDRGAALARLGMTDDSSRRSRPPNSATRSRTCGGVRWRSTDGLTR